jgi:hypothetical protein
MNAFVLSRQIWEHEQSAIILSHVTRRKIKHRLKELFFNDLVQIYELTFYICVLHESNMEDLSYIKLMYTLFLKW